MLLKKIFSYSLTFFLLIIYFLPVQAGPREEALLLLSSAALIETFGESENTMLPELLKNCTALGIFPSIKSGGYFIGGEMGKGVIIYKNSNTSQWSNPSFYKLYGGSLGLQIGFQESDLILIFLSKSAVKNILHGDFNIELDASAAAGRFSNSLKYNKDETIVAYSKSKGLFAGITVSGAKISCDYTANKNFYKEPLTPKMILMENLIENIPQSSYDFLRSINNTLQGERR